MGSSFQSLLDLWVEAKNAPYRNDVERAEAKQQALDYIVQTTLEKLRDQFDPG